MKEHRKIELLCQLRDLLDQTRMPTVRESGLTEKEAEVLADERLIDFSLVADEGEYLDRYRIDKLTAKAFGILSRAGHASAPLLRTSAQPPPGSVRSKILQALALGLWDLVKIALGIPVGIVIGWFLKKHFRC